MKLQAAYRPSGCAQRRGGNAEGAGFRCIGLPSRSSKASWTRVPDAGRGEEKLHGALDWSSARAGRHHGLRIVAQVLVVVASDPVEEGNRAMRRRANGVTATGLASCGMRAPAGPHRRLPAADERVRRQEVEVPRAPQGQAAGLTEKSSNVARRPAGGSRRQRQAVSRGSRSRRVEHRPDRSPT